MIYNKYSENHIHSSFGAITILLFPNIIASSSSPRGSVPTPCSPNSSPAAGAPPSGGSPPPDLPSPPCLQIHVHLHATSPYILVSPPPTSHNGRSRGGLLRPYQATGHHDACAGGQPRLRLPPWSRRDDSSIPPARTSAPQPSRRLTGRHSGTGDLLSLSLLHLPIGEPLLPQWPHLWPLEVEALG